MSDQDTLNTLSLVDDQVSDTPPEPETENSGAAVEAGQTDAASLQEQPEQEQGTAETFRELSLIHI